MSEILLGFTIPDGVHILTLEGIPFDDMVAGLPTRPQEDVNFGVSVLKAHPLFELLTRMMTISAAKKQDSRAILDRLHKHRPLLDEEAAMNPQSLLFLKECHALCVEFHVRCVKEFHATKGKEGRN